MAQWDGDKLTLHDTTQSVTNRRSYVAKMFGIPEGNVRVIVLFVGGGLAAKVKRGRLPCWPHWRLKQVKRPVKLVTERPQMFGMVGARPRTHQKLSLGATRDGKLTAIKHEVHAHTSVIEDYLESSAFATRVMYDCANVQTIHRLVQMNLGTPTYDRAPGVATGTYALEVAMDELAYKLKMDPLELRLKNYAEVDPSNKNPFTEKSLRECYKRASKNLAGQNAMLNRAPCAMVTCCLAGAWPRKPIPRGVCLAARWSVCSRTGAFLSPAARRKLAPVFIRSFRRLQPTSSAFLLLSST
jgi:Aerobic-type carbon monoxide dehydrogenase, large subunit CoxL/CutL homologs